MTPTTASSALSTRPLLAAFSSSMRESSASRDCDVLLRERVDERVLLVVDVAGELVELVVELALGVLADLLQVRGQLGHVVADLGAALGDPHAGGVQLAADDVGDLADHRRPSRSGSRAALRVERVDLVRHAEELVLEPAGSRRASRCSGRPCRRPSSRPRSPRTACGPTPRPLVNAASTLPSRPVEDAGHLGLGPVVDRLDVGGDLGPLGLVLALGLPLVADDLGQRRDLRALHARRAACPRPARPPRGPWRASLSCARYSAGAVALCSLAVWRASSAAVKSGSLAFASCSSVTPSRSISWSTSAGPAERSVSSAGRGPASRRRRRRSRWPRRLLGRQRVTWLGLGLRGVGRRVGGLLDVLLRVLLAALDEPPTSLLTCAALPDPLKSSASSRFLGAAASIAFWTAAMNALRSNVPGCWAPISSTCAPAAWLATSLPGGTAAAWAAAAPAPRAGGPWPCRPRPRPCPSSTGSSGPRSARAAGRRPRHPPPRTGRTAATGGGLARRGRPAPAAPAALRRRLVAPAAAPPRRTAARRPPERAPPGRPRLRRALRQQRRPAPPLRHGDTPPRPAARPRSAPAARRPCAAPAAHHRRAAPPASGSQRRPPHPPAPACAAPAGRRAGACLRPHLRRPLHRPRRPRPPAAPPAAAATACPQACCASACAGRRGELPPPAVRRPARRPPRDAAARGPSPPCRRADTAARGAARPRRRATRRRPPPAPDSASPRHLTPPDPLPDAAGRCRIPPPAALLAPAPAPPRDILPPPARCRPPTAAPTPAADDPLRGVGHIDPIPPPAGRRLRRRPWSAIMPATAALPTRRWSAITPAGLNGETGMAAGAPVRRSRGRRGPAGPARARVPSPCPRRSYSGRSPSARSSTASSAASSSMPIPATSSCSTSGGGASSASASASGSTSSSAACRASRATAWLLIAEAHSSEPGARGLGCRPEVAGRW